MKQKTVKDYLIAIASAPAESLPLGGDGIRGDHSTFDFHCRAFEGVDRRRNVDLVADIAQSENSEMVSAEGINLPGGVE